MSLDWLSAFLVFGLFYVVMVIGLALLLHLQLGLAGIGNFGVVGFWGIGMYAFGVAFVQRRLALRADPGSSWSRHASSGRWSPGWPGWSSGG